MASEEARFFCEGERCAALLDLPEDSGPWPGVVLCAGFRGTKEWLLAPMAQAYRVAGWAVLRFDYRGIGESDGLRGHLTPARQLEDVRSAVAFLAGVAQVQSGRLVVHGVGMGGGHALVAAAEDAAIAGVVVQAAIGDVRRAWLEPLADERRSELAGRLAGDRAERVRSGRGGRMDPGELMDNPQSRAALAEAAKALPGLAVPFTLEAVERVLEYVPEHHAGRISPRPVLVIGATRDAAAPVAESRRIFAAAGEPRHLELFETAHYELFEPPLAERVVALTTTWLETQLDARP